MRTKPRAAARDQLAAAAALVWGLAVAALVLRRAEWDSEARLAARGRRPSAAPHVLAVEDRGARLVDALAAWPPAAPMPKAVVNAAGAATLRVAVIAVLSSVVEEAAVVVEAGGGGLGAGWTASHAAGQRGLRTVIGLDEDPAALDDFLAFSWDGAVALPGRLGQARRRGILFGAPEYTLDGIARGEQGGTLPGGGVLAAVLHAHATAAPDLAAALAGGAAALAAGNIRYLFVALDLATLGGGAAAAEGLAPVLAAGLHCAILRGSGDGVPSPALPGPLAASNALAFWANVDAVRDKYVRGLAIRQHTFPMSLICSKRDSAWAARGAEILAVARARVRPPVRRGRAAPMFSAAQFAAAVAVAEAEQARDLARRRTHREVERLRFLRANEPPPPPRPHEQNFTAVGAVGGRGH